MERHGRYLPGALCFFTCDLFIQGCGPWPCLAFWPFAIIACSGGSGAPDAGSPDAGGSGTGGDDTGSGGRVSTGGAIGAGGAIGSGGAIGTGGAIGSGGAPASGGAPGSGGVATGGVAGTGGAVSTGGASSSGGNSGKGGGAVGGSAAAGRGGSASSGGAGGAGGGEGVPPGYPMPTTANRAQCKSVARTTLSTTGNPHCPGGGAGPSCIECLFGGDAYQDTNSGSTAQGTSEAGNYLVTVSLGGASAGTTEESPPRRTGGCWRA